MTTLLDTVRWLGAYRSSGARSTAPRGRGFDRGVVVAVSFVRYGRTAITGGPESPNLCIYTEVTGGHGVTPLTVRIVDVDEKRDPVVKLDLEVNLEDPLAVTQVVFGMPRLVFPEPGDYRIQAISGGSRLLEKRLILREAAQADLPEDAEDEEEEGV
jgi:hypothetical protein